MSKYDRLSIFMIVAISVCPTFSPHAFAQSTTPGAETTQTENTRKAPAPPPIELEEPIPVPDEIAKKQDEAADQDNNVPQDNGAQGTRARKKSDKAGKDSDQPPARIAAGGRVLAQARETLKKRGCDAAIPAYRVAAAMGEGFEAAQHELGDCLLSMQSDLATEKTLFREEGLFWLKRAAYAGNARAQRKLAVMLASPADAAHDPVASLGWALTYENNPDADLYGFGPLPRTLVSGLKNDLTADERASAERFSKEFEPLKLSPFEPKRSDEQKRKKKKRQNSK
ncbi:MAG: hypothetical protein AAF720_14140 [Pseudomonadota bacterium]